MYTPLLFPYTILYYLLVPDHSLRTSGTASWDFAFNITRNNELFEYSLVPSFSEVTHFLGHDTREVGILEVCLFCSCSK